MGEPKTRTLRLTLPAEVWERLDNEAAANGLSIGTFGRRLIVDRDTRRQDRLNPGAKS